MNRCGRWLASVLMAMMILVAACGGDGDSEPTRAASTPADAVPPGATTELSEPDDATAADTTGAATEPPGVTAPPAATTSSNGAGGTADDIQPCDILTHEEVETVLPDADDGFVAMAGGSLMEGVDAYQCSYSDPAFDIFIVILNVASTADDFDWIEPNPDSFGDEARELEIADGGWLRGDDIDMKLTAVKGWTVIDLQLMATGAGEHSEALIDLARLVVERIE